MISPRPAIFHGLRPWAASGSAGDQDAGRCPETQGKSPERLAFSSMRVSYEALDFKGNPRRIRIPGAHPARHDFGETRKGESAGATPVSPGLEGRRLKPAWVRRLPVPVPPCVGRRSGISAGSRPETIAPGPHTHDHLRRYRPRRRSWSVLGLPMISPPVAGEREDQLS